MTSFSSSTHTVVLGAGLTGAWIAAGLAAAGDSVRVLDKGRGPGGRLSVRRTDSGRFAHGCALDALASWLDVLPADVLRTRGLATGLDACDPRLQALPKHLLGDVEARYGVQVARIERSGERWRLLDSTDGVIAEARRLVLTAPAPQSAALLEPVQPAWSARLRVLRFAPSWCLLLAQPAEAHEPNWQAAAPWLAQVQEQQTLRGDTAEGRPLRRWVLRLSDALSAKLLEHAAQEVLEAVLDRLGANDQRWSHAAAHRWRFARVIDPLPEPLLFDPALQLGVCGDAFAGGLGDCDLQRCRLSADALLQHWTADAHPAASPA